MPAAVSARRTFFTWGFCAIPTTTTAWLPIACCTSRTTSGRKLSIPESTAGARKASSRRGRLAMFISEAERSASMDDMRAADQVLVATGPLR